MVESSVPVYVLPEERLVDSIGDRKVPVDKVPLPPAVPLTKERAYHQANGIPDHNLIREYIFATGMVSKELFIQLCVDVAPKLGNEQNLLRLEGKVVIVGDIHGQFFDLVAMLRKLS